VFGDDNYLPIKIHRSGINAPAKNGTAPNPKNIIKDANAALQGAACKELE